MTINFLELQLRQVEFEDVFKPKFACLPRPRKLKDTAISFAANVGALFEDDANAPCLLAKGLQIALSLAAELNINLNKQMPEVAAPFLGVYAQTVGKMSKAGEAFDHAENYPSRAVFEEQSLYVTSLLLKEMGRQEINVVSALGDLWEKETAYVWHKPKRANGVKDFLKPESIEL